MLMILLLMMNRLWIGVGRVMSWLWLIERIILLVGLVIVWVWVGVVKFVSGVLR